MKFCYICHVVCYKGQYPIVLALYTGAHSRLDYVFKNCTWMNDQIFIQKLILLICVRHDGQMLGPNKYTCKCMIRI